MCEICSRQGSAITRRHVLRGVAMMTAGIALTSSFANAMEGSSGVGPDDALKRLMEGNERYVAGMPNNQNHSADRAARAAAQYPIAAILSCSDSRVAPELVFDQGPGNLFVVRVAGNFVNDDGLASLEYAVKYLGVSLLMVMGHSGCGAVSAAIKVVEEDAKLPGHLDDMIREIRPAVAEVRGMRGNVLEETIDANVRHAVQRLETAAPILSGRISDGGVKVVGCRYEIATGQVSLI
jgi:carbonic anhydrase